MTETTATLGYECDLHARLATKLVALCQTFTSDITLCAGGAEMNAKSIVSLMSGGVAKGSAVHIQATGPDEKQAIDAVAAFISALSD